MALRTKTEEADCGAILLIDDVKPAHRKQKAVSKWN
jgi:hypothetical protein